MPIRKIRDISWKPRYFVSYVSSVGMVMKPMGQEGSGASVAKKRPRLGSTAPVKTPNLLSESADL